MVLRSSSDEIHPSPFLSNSLKTCLISSRLGGMEKGANTCSDPVGVSWSGEVDWLWSGVALGKLDMVLHNKNSRDDVTREDKTREVLVMF